MKLLIRLSNKWGIVMIYYSNKSESHKALTYTVLSSYMGCFGQSCNNSDDVSVIDILGISC